MRSRSPDACLHVQHFQQLSRLLLGEREGLVAGADADTAWAAVLAAAAGDVVAVGEVLTPASVYSTERK